MKKAVLGLAILVASQPAFAGVLNLEAGAKAIEGVNIAKAATATVDGRSYPLTAVGGGLRKKKFGGIIPVKVYVGQLLVSAPSTFNRSEDGALNSLAEMSALAMQLNLLMSVDGKKIQDGFKDALAANNVDANTPVMQTLLNAVVSDEKIVEGGTVTFVGEKLADGSEAVTYENSKGQATTVTGGAGFIKSVFSMWFGTPADSGVGQLKKDILGGNGL